MRVASRGLDHLIAPAGIGKDPLRSDWLLPSGKRAAIRTQRIAQMKIFQVSNSPGHEWAEPKEAGGYKIFRDFDGTHRSSTWNPIKVIRIRSDGSAPLAIADFPWLSSHVLVMRRSAVEGLSDILGRHGELLPLETDDCVELHAYNANTVDALDETNSTIQRFSSSNKIMLIKRAAFLEERVRGIDIFRLPILGTSTYVSDRFVDRVRAMGLRGLDFEEQWSDES